MEVTPISASGVRPTTDDRMNTNKAAATEKRTVSASQHAQENQQVRESQAISKQTAPVQVIEKKEVPIDLAVEKMAASLQRSDPSMDFSQAARIARQILGDGKNTKTAHPTNNATEDETPTPFRSIDTRL